jgi:intracellular multiplication protein IcmD
MTDLFTAASTDPALVTQIADALQSAASKTGVNFNNDAQQMVQLAESNPQFKAAAQSALQQLAKAGNLSFVITSASEAAGFAFSLPSLVTFTQHKDNPTQIPVGTPIALLFIGAALLFLPTILSTVGETMFGPEAMAAAAEGVSGVGV